MILFIIMIFLNWKAYILEKNHFVYANHWVSAVLLIQYYHPIFQAYHLLLSIIMLSKSIMNSFCQVTIIHIYSDDLPNLTKLDIHAGACNHVKSFQLSSKHAYNLIIWSSSANFVINWWVFFLWNKRINSIKYIFPLLLIRSSFFRYHQHWGWIIFQNWDYHIWK